MVPKRQRTCAAQRVQARRGQQRDCSSGVLDKRVEDKRCEGRLAESGRVGQGGQRGGLTADFLIETCEARSCLVQQGWVGYGCEQAAITLAGWTLFGWGTHVRIARGTGGVDARGGKSIGEAGKGGARLVCDGDVLASKHIGAAGPMR